MLNKTLSVTSCFVICVSWSLASLECQAQIVPFKASGDQAIYSPSTGATSGPGQATHMGKVLGSGLALPGVEIGPGLFEWSAPNYQFEAANGDTIALTGGGTVQFVPLNPTGLFFAVWSGEFNVITGSGTGRFANVGPGTAPIQIVAVNDPFTFPPTEGDIWTYSWNLDGNIDLGKR